MKIKKNINLKDLEKLGYNYQENLIYPTYKKIIKQNKSTIIIEILILDKTTYINKNKKITNTQLKYIEDLKYSNLIVIENIDNIKDKFWLKNNRSEEHTSELQSH